MKPVEDWKPLLEAASSDIRRLDYVIRYSSIPVSVPEAVSTHMYWVALYAMMVHRHLEGPTDVDCTIMLHGLTHDALEALSGDIVRTFKYSSEEFRQAVDKAEEGLGRYLPAEVRSLLSEVDNTLRSYEDGEFNWKRHYVKDVVKVADFMSLYQYMWRERRRGNVEVEQFFGRMVEDLEAQARKLRTRAGPGDGGLHYLRSLACLYDGMREGFVQKFTVE
jgi:5'-deoxynucleotidase YfbR-like HD superfamily hydrolase